MLFKKIKRKGREIVPAARTSEDPKLLLLLPAAMAPAVIRTLDASHPLPERLVPRTLVALAVRPRHRERGIEHVANPHPDGRRSRNDAGRNGRTIRRGQETTQARDLILGVLDVAGSRLALLVVPGRGIPLPGDSDSLAPESEIGLKLLLRNRNDHNASLRRTEVKDGKELSGFPAGNFKLL